MKLMIIAASALFTTAYTAALQQLGVNINPCAPTSAPNMCRLGWDTNSGKRITYFGAVIPIENYVTIYSPNCEEWGSSSIGDFDDPKVILAKGLDPANPLTFTMIHHPAYSFGIPLFSYAGKTWSENSCQCQEVTFRYGQHDVCTCEFECPPYTFGV